MCSTSVTITEEQQWSRYSLFLQEKKGHYWKHWRFPKRETVQPKAARKRCAVSKSGAQPGGLADTPLPLLSYPTHQPSPTLISSICNRLTLWWQGLVCAGLNDMQCKVFQFINILSAGATHLLSRQTAPQLYFGTTEQHFKYVTLFHFFQQSPPPSWMPQALCTSFSTKHILWHAAHTKKGVTILG